MELDNEIYTYLFYANEHEFYSMTGKLSFVNFVLRVCPNAYNA